MRRTASEKQEIIRMVEGSDLSVRQTLREIGICKTTFYNWLERFEKLGFDGLEDLPPRPRRIWNRIPGSIKDQVVQLALAKTELSPRELSCLFTDRYRYFISEASCYRILKAHDLITSPAYILLQAGDSFQNPTKRVHELWQTDFTYFKIIGWGWYYLSTVLDDFSRYIIAWKLSPTMGSTDVQETLDIALAATGLEKARVHHKPRLLSDNGPAYLSSELKDYLKDKQMKHSRGRPYHPQTQGKIERYHRTMKNVVKLDNYYLPGDLERELARFVEHYNHRRPHEALKNVTPADVYEGRQHEVLSMRYRIKERTMKRRKQLHYAAKAA